MKIRNIKNIFAVLAMVLVIAGTLILVVLRTNRMEAERQQLAERIELAKSYEERIEKDEKKITALDVRKREIEKIGCSMMSFLFMQCSDNLYNEAYQYMTLWKATGFFTVGKEEYPGKEGCITVEQYTKLCDAGWVPVVSASEEQLTEQYLSEMDMLFQGLGEKPKAIAFGRRKILAEEVELVVSKGYEIVFYDAQRSPEFSEKATEIGLQYIPFYYSSRKTYVGTAISDYIKKGGSAVLAVGHVTVQVSTELEDRDQLLSSLKQSVCDLAQNYNYYTDSAVFMEEAIQKNTVVKDELIEIKEQESLLRDEISALRKEINSIYQK